MINYRLICSMCMKDAFLENANLHLVYAVPKQKRVVPEKLRTLDHGRPWSDDQFASTRLSSNRDMSR